MAIRYRFELIDFRRSDRYPASGRTLPVSDRHASNVRLKMDRFLKSAATLVVLFAIAGFTSCSPELEEDLPTFLERGVYRSTPTGDEILIGDVDAVITFKDQKFVVVGFDALDDGTLKFTPLEGREDSYAASVAARSSWTWEPRVIRQHTGETTLQAFTMVRP